MKPAEMTCAEVRELLRELPQPERAPAALLEHLQTCAACQTVQHNHELVRQILQQLPPPEVPAGFELELRRRLRIAAAEPEHVDAATDPRPSADAGLDRPARTRWRLVALAAAAALLLAAGTLLLLRHRRPADGLDGPAVTYHRLHLSVSTTRAHPAVFEVRLPEGTRLAPAAGTALVHAGALRWRSALQPGRNAFDLPLEASAIPDVDPSVWAAVRVDGRTHRARVRLALAPLAAGSAAGEARAVLHPSLGVAMRAGTAAVRRRLAPGPWPRPC